VLNAEYFKRIDALNYTMMHDDGQHVEGLEEADVVLVGVSRTSKTPTSIYLANRGIRTGEKCTWSSSPSISTARKSLSSVLANGCCGYDPTKAALFCLYPTPDQAAQLAQITGACRSVYNFGLEQRRDWYRPGRKFTFATRANPAPRGGGLAKSRAAREPGKAALFWDAVVTAVSSTAGLVVADWLAPQS
jgi:Kinase/pyrophosphorylase/Helix-turn-helix domain